MASRSVTADAGLERELERHRKELTGYCYRMLGSGFEAEDAVQETMIRAWKGIDNFENRSALRSWLYRIATNVCLDMLRGPQRRARPMDLSPSGTAESFIGASVPEHNWVMPIADAKVLPDAGDPAALAEARESIRLAFVAALQHLPARQRAVLILREVLKWQASEVAELLDTSVASVNSALQRARATLADQDLDSAPTRAVGAEQQDILARYVDAFERYDIESLVALLHKDAEFTMPPFPLWLQGVTEIAKWYPGQGAGCEGSRLVATAANGRPAFGSYKPAGPGRWEPWAIQVIDISAGRVAGEGSRELRITGLHHFIYPELFEAFGLPPYLEA